MYLHRLSDIIDNMKIVTKPKTTASAEQLAQVHRHLIAAFVINVLFTMLAIEPLDLPTLTVLLLFMLSIAARIYMCVALYRAAQRIGFGMTTIVISLILSFFIPLLGLILIISADIRLSKLLKAKGWKVGLLGATPK